MTWSQENSRFVKGATSSAAVVNAPRVSALRPGPVCDRPARDEFSQRADHITTKPVRGWIVREQFGYRCQWHYAVKRAEQKDQPNDRRHCLANVARMFCASLQWSTGTVPITVVWPFSAAQRFLLPTFRLA